ncbi:hypothetical protein [Marinilactibacillus psychrotolerans]|uniref:hypothetical protein n=1 Tax=Marinilactibacillus psychrotolerans TaxID=191770 RepID=UPI00388B7C5A
MIKSNLDKLFEKQKEIQKNLSILIQEEIELTKQIEKYYLSEKNYSSKSLMKEKIHKELKSIGFKLLPNKVNNIRTLKLVKNNHSLQIAIVQSAYQDKSYNAWYTLKPGIENIVDFIIFIYSDRSGNYSFAVISQQTLRVLLERLNKMPDGRVNIKLQADTIKVFEIQVKMDLSDNINSLNLLLNNGD